MWLITRMITWDIEAKMGDDSPAHTRLYNPRLRWHVYSHEIIQSRVALTRLLTRIIEVKRGLYAATHTNYRIQVGVGTSDNTDCTIHVRSYTSTHTDDTIQSDTWQVWSQEIIQSKSGMTHLLTWDCTCKVTSYRSAHTNIDVKWELTHLLTWDCTCKVTSDASGYTNIQCNVTC